MSSLGLPTVVTGLVLVHLTLALLVFRWRWQCREKPPVSEKYVRGPGETLRLRLEKLDERTDALLLATSFAPLAVLFIGALLSRLAGLQEHNLAVFVVTLVLFVAAAGAGAFFLLRTLQERRLARLALQGHRIVAESLASLVPEGFSIFHDVPTELGEEVGNVHHIIIGPGGIFAVEAQTHPKRKPMPGRKSHEIVYDGEQLIYPWGQDTLGLVPARDKAEWLTEWLFQVAGERIVVNPVLTFPGWWVTSTAQRDVRVCNPNQLAAVMLRAPDNGLGDRKRALIARHLESRCRDVEF